jgi:hypothetical protein
MPMLKKTLPGMCYPVGEIRRRDYHPYSYHRPSPAGEIRSLVEREGFVVTETRRIIFVLKNVPDLLFPAARGLEKVLESLPPTRLLASTLIVRAEKPSTP